MAVIFAAEKAEQRTATGNSDGSRTYTRLFWVVTDSAADGPQSVAGSGFVPFPFDVYIAGNDIDIGARAQSVTPLQPTMDPTYWEVRVEYSSQAIQEIQNPLARPTDIAWGFQVYQKAIIKDINGNPIVNKANKQFDPVPEIDDCRPTLTFTKNLATFDPSLAYSYVNSINATAWYGGASQTWKCMNIASSQQIENGVYFYPTTFEFQYHYETWKLFILNAGIDQLSGGKHEPCTYQTGPFSGQPVTEPVPLDNNGAQITSPTFSNMVILSFDVYRQQEFNNLSLP